MKRFLAIALTLLILASLAVLPASAAKNAETKVTAKKGDEVIYSLNLTVPENVVGCDLSVYYDSSQFKPIASADFTGSFDPEKQQAFLNHNLKDEAKCVFSILNGINFKTEKSIFSLKLQAQKDVTDAHITYYVRYLYPLDKDPAAEIKQFTEYKLTCDVTVNGKKVTDNKAPELNVDDVQSQGEFINSVTGDGKDANVNMADKKDTNSNGDKNENPNNNNNNNNNNSNTTTDKTDDKNTTDKNDNKTDADKQDTTSVTDNGGVDKPQSVETSTADSAKDDSSSNIFTSIWFWIVIGAGAVAVAAGVVIVLNKKKQ